MKNKKKITYIYIYTYIRRFSLTDRQGKGEEFRDLFNPRLIRTFGKKIC